MPIPDVQTIFLISLASFKDSLIQKLKLTLYLSISDYAINSILYQRGIYPSEKFDYTTKYNLKIVETCDDQLKEYLNNVLTQLEGGNFVLLCNLYCVLCTVYCSL